MFIYPSHMLGLQKYTFRSYQKPYFRFPGKHSQFYMSNIYCIHLSRPYVRLLGMYFPTLYVRSWVQHLPKLGLSQSRGIFLGNKTKYLPSTVSPKDVEKGVVLITREKHIPKTRTADCGAELVIPFVETITIHSSQGQ